LALIQPPPLVAFSGPSNSVFFCRETHIPDPLLIMVLYINVYEFLKKSNLGSKSKGVSLQQKLIETLYFLAAKPIF
jgi:hypothetical protein